MQDKRTIFAVVIAAALGLGTATAVIGETFVTIGTGGVTGV